MTAVEILAIAKAVVDKRAKEARGQMRPGAYPVDITVHLAGEVTVGEDGDKASTPSLLSEDFLFLALHFAGVTRERAIEVIEQVAAEALRSWVGSDADKKAAKATRTALVDSYDVEGVIRSRFDAVKARLPRTPVAGSAKFVGSVEEVQG